MAAACDPQRHASEIEIKLAFDPADAARIAALPALQASVAPPEEQQLVSTYFDTPDSALRKAGVYLRVRERAGRYVQTIKTAKSETDLLERLEWEREISGRDPDLDGVEGTPLQPLLTPKLRAALQPIFETRIRRLIHRIEQNGSEIEVAIDQGEIATRSATRPISEVELELKHGEVRELLRLARTLAEQVPLRLEVKTKAERGFELLAGGGFRVEKAAEIDIPPAMAAADAFRAIARSCLRQIVANETAICAGHAEALHQMRIGLRRLRAAIAVFVDVVGDEKQNKIEAELKWITRELGPARDLDVFAADVLEPLTAAHPGDAEIAATRRDFEGKRKAAYARAANAVRSERYRNIVLDLVVWIEVGPWTEDDDKHRKALATGSVAEHAKTQLAGLRKKIRSKGGDLRHLSVRQKHSLRIRAKRLRYATEFFASTFASETSAKRRTETLTALKDLQDALGGLNDLAMRHTLIAGALGGEANGGEGSAPASRLKEDDAEAKALLLKAEQAFARFADTKPFWKG